MVNTEQVVVNGEDVIIGIDNVFGAGAIKEVAYLVVTEVDPVVKYTFAIYRDPDWRDWKSSDGAGIDATAFLVTGYLADTQGGKDFARQKQFPYLYVHCNRTENGFLEDINGDLYPSNPSSCMVQTRWEWSDSAASKRWGNPFQAYRYKRFYMPSGPSDAYDTGFATIVTKNRLRGQGKVLSIKFYTEEYRDLHLYGWSIMGSTANGF